MTGDFFDTNILLYLLDDGPKADAAERILATGGVISVQVLNEALVNCRRKAQMSWEEAAQFLHGVRQLCDTVELTAETHDLGLALCARYGFAVYDGMIVAAALQHGCTRLVTEDMQNGMLVEGALTLWNPFA